MNTYGPARPGHRLCKEANPDVVGSLRRAVADINALPQAPAFVVHTGDVGHLSKPEEFGQARELLQEIHVARVHTIPGERDTIDDGDFSYICTVHPFMTGVVHVRKQQAELEAALARIS
jgi:hypothetical protein